MDKLRDGRPLCAYAESIDSSAANAAAVARAIAAARNTISASNGRCRSHPTLHATQFRRLSYCRAEVLAVARQYSYYGHEPGGMLNVSHKRRRVPGRLAPGTLHYSLGKDRTVRQSELPSVYCIDQGGITQSMINAGSAIATAKETAVIRISIATLLWFAGICFLVCLSRVFLSRYFD